MAINLLQVRKKGKNKKVLVQLQRATWKKIVQIKDFSSVICVAGPFVCLHCTCVLMHVYMSQDLMNNLLSFSLRLARHLSRFPILIYKKATVVF